MTPFDGRGAEYGPTPESLREERTKALNDLCRHCEVYFGRAKTLYNRTSLYHDLTTTIQSPTIEVVRFTVLRESQSGGFPYESVARFTNPVTQLKSRGKALVCPDGPLHQLLTNQKALSVFSYPVSNGSRWEIFPGLAKSEYTSVHQNDSIFLGPLLSIHENIGENANRFLAQDGTSLWLEAVLLTLSVDQSALTLLPIAEQLSKGLKDTPRLADSQSPQDSYIDITNVI